MIGLSLRAQDVRVFWWESRSFAARGDFRRRASEEAAQKVVQGLPMVFSDPCRPHSRMDEPR